MKFAVAAAFILGLVPTIWSSAIPVLEDTTLSSPELDKRTLISNINTGPVGDVTCDTFTLQLNNINEALSQGTRWAGASPPIQMGQNSYPHIFKNYDGINFKNCVGIPIYEYPVLRKSANPWVPAGKSTKLPNAPDEPDRVIFSPSGTDSATYCGVITHSGSGFAMCT